MVQGASEHGDGRRQRKFKSLCSQRYVCRRCTRVVYARGKKHVCGGGSSEQQQFQKCEECQGIHPWNYPCFIQPVSVDRLNSMLQKRGRGQLPINPNSINIASSDSFDASDDYDDGEEQEVLSDVDGSQKSNNNNKPYRYFIFDIECEQSNEVTPGQFKHVPLLICAELICTECIAAGIKIGRSEADNPPRPEKCICKGADTIYGRGRQWVMPNSGGRQFAFHAFDDARINPVDEMLDFLSHHGPLKTNTLALSHNG